MLCPFKSCLVLSLNWTFLFPFPCSSVLLALTCLPCSFEVWLQLYIQNVVHCIKLGKALLLGQHMKYIPAIRPIRLKAASLNVSQFKRRSEITAHRSHLPILLLCSPPLSLICPRSPSVSITLYLGASVLHYMCP